MRSQARALHQQITKVRQRLAGAIAVDRPTPELEDLRKRLDLLAGIQRRRRRRQSLAWSAVVISTAVLVAVVLGYAVHLRRVSVVLTATANAFTFVNGPNQLLFNPASIKVGKVTSSLPGVRGYCVECAGERNAGADAVESLRLNALLINPRAVATLRASGRCFEVAVVEGSVEAMITAFAMQPPGRTAGHPIPTRQTLRLTPGHFVHACAEDEPLLQLKGITAITVGDQTGVAAAERQTYPSLLSGTLFLADTSRAIELRRTDVPYLGGLQDSNVVARARDHIELTAFANASAITVDTIREESVMPSWLEWLRSNPAIQGGLAALAAIVAGAFALRQRLLDEID